MFSTWLKENKIMAFILKAIHKNSQKLHFLILTKHWVLLCFFVQVTRKKKEMVSLAAKHFAIDDFEAIKLFRGSSFLPNSLLIASVGQDREFLHKTIRSEKIIMDQRSLILDPWIRIRIFAKERSDPKT
jgi:hypothetical protein